MHTSLRYGHVRLDGRTSSGLLTSTLQTHYRRNRGTNHRTVNIVKFDSEDIVIERSLGTLGFFNVSSYTPRSRLEQPYLPGLDLSDIQRLGQQEIAPGGIVARIYTGRVARGPLSGTRIILKAYPAPGQAEADALAANEVASHAILQPPVALEESPYLCKLLGGFQTKSGPQAGEQWLVFRNDGAISASAYAAEAAQATAQRTSVGQWEFFDRWDPQRPVKRRRIFVLKILRHALQGLNFMHKRQRLHQSLGPASVVLNRTDEMEVSRLSARLRDFAFAVDISDEALIGGPTLADIWEKRTTASQPDPRMELAEGLWRRAEQGGAQTTSERRNFGISDDIYAAGLLLAYMAFVPFSQPGSIDAPSLQRLLETTFQLDIEAAREYCEADERWEEAVRFLSDGNGAGWNLLAAMLNPEWRLRPTAESCLNHPFLRGLDLGLPAA